MSETTNQPSKTKGRSKRWISFVLRVCEMIIAILTSIGINSCTNLLQ